MYSLGPVGSRGVPWERWACRIYELENYVCNDPWQVLSQTRIESAMSLIRAASLAKLLQSAKPPRVLDSTWFLPNSPFAAPEGSTTGALGNFQNTRIPNAQFFDLDSIGDAAIAPTSAHNLPTATVFGMTMVSPHPYPLPPLISLQLPPTNTDSR